MNTVRSLNIKTWKLGILTLACFTLGFLCHATLFSKNSDLIPNGKISFAQSKINNTTSDQRTNSYNKSLQESSGLTIKAHHQPVFKSAKQIKKQITQLNKAPNNSLNDSILNISIAEWAQVSPEEALQHLLTLNNQEQQKLIPVLMAVAGQNKNNFIENWLQQNKQHKQHAYWAQAYYHSYAHSAPEAALQSLNEHYSADERGDLLSSIIDAWAKLNIDATLNWLDQQQTNTLTQELYNRAINQYIQQDPSSAALLVTKLNASDNKNQLISATANALAQQDIYGALDWAETLQGNERAIALSTVMNDWASQGIPEAALDYVLADNNLQSNSDVLVATVSNIANHDHYLLIERLSEFNESNKVIVVQEIANAFMRQDHVNDFELWYQNLSNGAQREAASVAAINANLRKRPQLAFKYAENVISSQSRKNYLAQAAKSWANESPAQARIAIETTNVLNPEQKQSILKQLTN
ncbi:hypothetical protein [Agaribacterium sp. ZY112]|uniref:hypothetical protein n=1 Tax=Agaribacterium sp. ZY112 TaxID=3233574 RepID=UPI0035269ADF